MTSPQTHVVYACIVNLILVRCFLAHALKLLVANVPVAIRTRPSKSLSHRPFNKGWYQVLVPT